MVLTLPCIFILPRYERLLAEYKAPGIYNPNGLNVEDLFAHRKEGGLLGDQPPSGFRRLADVPRHVS